jgi:hypothetical protein
MKIALARDAQVMNNLPFAPALSLIDDPLTHCLCWKAALAQRTSSRLSLLSDHAFRQ